MVIEPGLIVKTFFPAKHIRKTLALFMIDQHDGGVYFEGGRKCVIEEGYIRSAYGRMAEFSA